MTEQQKAELERRFQEFQANPTVIEPFEDDFFDNLKLELAHERAKKASAHPR